MGSREQLICTCFLSEFPELPSKVKPVTNIPISKYRTILKEIGHSYNCWGFHHVLNNIVNTLWIKWLIWGSYKIVLNEWTLGKKAKQKSLILEKIALEIADDHSHWDYYDTCLCKESVMLTTCSQRRRTMLRLLINWVCPVSGASVLFLVFSSFISYCCDAENMWISRWCANVSGFHPACHRSSVFSTLRHILFSHALLHFIFPLFFVTLSASYPTNQVSKHSECLNSADPESPHLFRWLA